MLRQFYLRRKFWLIPLTTVLAVGCVKQDLQEGSKIKGEGDRSELGRAAPYPAIKLDPEEVNSNAQLRRQHAWDMLKKSTELVTLASDPTGQTKVPRFLTWYERGEVRPLAETLYRENPQGVTRGFSDEAIEKVMAEHFKAKTLDPDLFEHDPDTGSNVHASTAGTLFSESMLAHYLRNAEDIINCDPFDGIDWVQLKADGESRSFSPCLKDEFPTDSVMIKARWRRVSESNTVFTRDFPTDSATIDKLFVSPAELGQMPSDRVEVDAGDMYVIKDSRGDRWALEALHIVTKEVDEWVWATYWWSSTPDKDLGADRPAMDGSINNYKMCVATTFNEEDVNPGDRFADEELAHVLNRMADPAGVMETIKGTAAWCANPYIEGSFHKETCIGCHQTAGKGGFGPNYQEEVSFPGDFTFAFSTFSSILEFAKEQNTPDPIDPTDPTDPTDPEGPIDPDPQPDPEETSADSL